MSGWGPNVTKMHAGVPELDARVDYPALLERGRIRIGPFWIAENLPDGLTSTQPGDFLEAREGWVAAMHARAAADGLPISCGAEQEPASIKQTLFAKILRPDGGDYGWEIEGGVPHWKGDFEADWHESLARARRCAASNRSPGEEEKLEAIGLDDLPHRDALTGLPSFSALGEATGNALAGRTAQSVVALCLLDIDGMRTLNDRFGMALTDTVIAALARRIREAVSAEHLVGRVGGDEFGVLWTDLEYPDGALTRAEDLVNLCREVTNIGDQRTRVAVSAGVAVATPRLVRARDLLDGADLALREAKRQGGDQAIQAVG